MAQGPESFPGAVNSMEDLGDDDDDTASQCSQHCVLAAGCWLLAAGCWLLTAGCWLLAARNRSRGWDAVEGGGGGGDSIFQGDRKSVV